MIFRRNLLPRFFIFLLFLLIYPVVVFGEATKPPNSDVLFFYKNPPAVVGAGKFASDQLALSAYSALVMDAETGQVLYAKNPHQPRAIASTTKIMTALVAIECGNLNSVTSVSQRAAGVEGSSVYLKPNEKLTLEQLLYGALMRSGNDACVAIAEQIAVREDIFVGFMNLKARQLGARNTNFCNSNGLPNDNHYSSAYDMALITRYALKNSVFSRIVSTKSHTIPGPEGQRDLNNTNKMLWGYQGANGVKTGTTNAAGKCLVSSASRDGRQLIAVVLHSDDRWNESIKLLNYGFSKFKNRTIAEAGKTFATVKVKEGVLTKVPVTVDRNIVVTVPVDSPEKFEKVIEFEKEINAPVQPGQVVGNLQVLVEGQPVTGTNLVTQQGSNKIPYYRSLWQKVCNKK